MFSWCTPIFFLVSEHFNPFPSNSVFNHVFQQAIVMNSVSNPPLLFLVILCNSSLLSSTIIGPFSFVFLPTHITSPILLQLRISDASNKYHFKCRRLFMFDNRNDKFLLLKLSCSLSIITLILKLDIPHQSNYPALSLRKNIPSGHLHFPVTIFRFLRDWSVTV